MSDSNEAAAVAFFAYKRTDGFEVSLTLRDDNGKAVLERIDAAITLIKSQGGTPVSKNFSKFPPKPEVPTKPCPIHPDALMKEKISRANGEKFYSHSRGVYPNLDYCNGAGFKLEAEL